MDFFYPSVTKSKKGVNISASFRVLNRKDLMTRGGAFYAVWDEENQIWSESLNRVVEIIDRALDKKKQELIDDGEQLDIHVSYTDAYNTSSWTTFNQYVKSLPDYYHPLNDSVKFQNDTYTKEDYVSKVLPYPMIEGDISAYDELMGTLYSPEEREKLEWAIGAIISGDSKQIQKFIVLYGEAGTGKSTVLNIIQMLFPIYYVVFNGQLLIKNDSNFAYQAFSSNPLIGIQHDGDMSKIEDNSKLNSLVSHEPISVNEKYKAPYTMTPHTFLFMGTNSPIKITDGKSGVIRRLIDVSPTGNLIDVDRYEYLMDQIEFELGAIAYHCLKVYQLSGMNRYKNYRPYSMMMKTNSFYNFVEENYYFFKSQPYVTLKQAYAMYKQYVIDSNLTFTLSRMAFREELKNYFRVYKEHGRFNGELVRNGYSEFLTNKFDTEHQDEAISNTSIPLIFNEDNCNKLSELIINCPAQLANQNETPSYKWDDVKTTLADIDERELHYVKVPENHIVIDFDLKDENGEKSKELNLQAAAKFPPTYGEFSKGGSGVHLHYIYDGDVGRLNRLYSDGIEIKVFTGKSSLRRKFTQGNNLPVAHISSGLPLKEEKMVSGERVKTEKGIRELIGKNLRKEIHPNTAPSVSFIYEILENAYKDGLHYDVSDLRPKILAFANNSSNQSDQCIKMVMKMKFHSDEPDPGSEWSEEAPIVFFDIEVFPNLFVICWKKEGEGHTIVKMINPSANDIMKLTEYRLIGFNNRRYDNHVVYGAFSGACNKNGDPKGYSNEELFQLSQHIINDSVMKYGFLEAYNISYTDIYDFASNFNKKSLKKFEIELGIHHQELGLPWDKPVPENLWEKVAEYCCNDVSATEATFRHLRGDWIARQILAKLSGLTVNHSTNAHSTKIIFGDNKTPQSEFYYRNLAEPVESITKEMEDFLKERTTLSLDFDPYDKGIRSILPYFPGYRFENGVSIYRGEEVGEGGFVYAEPGMYSNVALLDVASMHPSSAEDEFLFGPYTWIFSDLKNSRIAIKHKDKEALSKYLNGALVEFLELADTGEFNLKDLSNALKTVINSVYGLTRARFDTAFRDSRNIDNIVAKRGALFMIDLKNAVQERGFTVAHIKTDSIKIPNATPEIIKFVEDFGRMYGYVFEHEATYERMCLVNDAVYIAKDAKDGHWTATGAEFAHPYIFKTLFSKEDIGFLDYCETKSVSKGSIYLDFNEQLGKDEHNYTYIGKVGLFLPVRDGVNGGVLLRGDGDKYYAVTGTKDLRWFEAETVIDKDWRDLVDYSYHENLVNDAIKHISQYGDYEWFVSEDMVAPYNNQDDQLPWNMPCGRFDCKGCPELFEDGGGVLHCKRGYSPLPF